MLLTIISGRSGAGKSVALSTFEDMGFYCVDNIPLTLLPALTKTIEKNNVPLAVSIDVRNLSDHSIDIKQLLQSIDPLFSVQIIFLDAKDETLIRRYNETRRNHPLANNGIILEEAIEKERALLDVIRTHADLVINTDTLSVHELSAQLRLRVLGKRERELTLIIESFGFKYGVPTGSDFVFDVRFLPNPHWDPTLRPLTGLDSDVQHFLSQKQEVTEFVKETVLYLQRWLPFIKGNNRSYLTISIGCTGGQHRSVYVAEQIAARFRALDEQVQIRHNTLER